MFSQEQAPYLSLYHMGGHLVGGVCGAAGILFTQNGVRKAACKMESQVKTKSENPFAQCEVPWKRT